MVQEIRRIILSKDELIGALEAHNRMLPDYLPEGKPVDFEIVDESNIRVTVQDRSVAQETSVLLSGVKLLQALIRFCLENNIMLPREGRKSVHIDDHNVSLCIDLEVDTFLMYGTASSFSSLYAFGR